MHPRAPIPHLTHRQVLPRPQSRLGRLLETVAGLFALPLVFAGAAASLLALTRLNLIGVKVTTTARSGSGDILRAVGSRYFVGGLAERGDTANAVRVRSMDDYVKEFGNRVSYGFLTDDLQAYFEEGGTEAYVTRVVGASATKGTKTLVDRAGSPLSTIALTALSAGAWSANMTVAVANAAVSNTFTITLTYNSGLADETIETYKDLTDPADAVAKINGRSRLVTAVNSGSATAAPNNNPAVLGATAFTSGNDDRGAVTASTIVTALTRFPASLGPGAVAIPGYDLSLVGAGLIAHCKAAGNRVALTHDVVGDSIAGLKTLAATFYGTADSEWGEIAGPWVKIPDGAGGTRTVPPTGFVAGVRARAHQKSGPWRWPAGNAGLATYVVGVELDIDLTNASACIDTGANPIRNVVGQGIELYGWRSLSTQPAYYSLAARDTLNLLAWQASQALEPYVYNPIDSKGVTVAGITSELVAICETMREAGGLFERRDAGGNILDPGYSITVTANSVARSITAVVAVRIAEAAELINVTITKVASDQAV